MTMRTIKLGGVLGKKFGKQYTLDVHSFRDAMAALWAYTYHVQFALIIFGSISPCILYQLYTISAPCVHNINSTNAYLYTFRIHPISVDICGLDMVHRLVTDHPVVGPIFARVESMSTCWAVSDVRLWQEGPGSVCTYHTIGPDTLDSLFV